jgi:biopolymer transport protein ExbD
MKIPNSISRGSTTFNMTPMIDVVFLLIIFFLVSSHLAKQDALELDLPNANSARPDTDQDELRVTVNVLEDGSLMIGGVALPQDQLETRLRSEVAAHGKNLAVRIRGSQIAPYERVEPILVACAKAGIWNVSHAVYPDQEQ